jgi:hypothetical protein
MAILVHLDPIVDILDICLTTDYPVDGLVWSLVLETVTKGQTILRDQRLFKICDKCIPTGTVRELNETFYSLKISSRSH